MKFYRLIAPEGRIWYKVWLNQNQMESLPWQECVWSQAEVLPVATMWRTVTKSKSGPSRSMLNGSAFGSKAEKRYVRVRLSTRGLRNIEKIGVEACIAELRQLGLVN